MMTWRYNFCTAATSLIYCWCVVLHTGSMSLLRQSSTRALRLAWSRPSHGNGVHHTLCRAQNGESWRCKGNRKQGKGSSSKRGQHPAHNVLKEVHQHTVGLQAALGIVTAARAKQMWCMSFTNGGMQDHCSPHWQVAHRSACKAPASLALGSGTTRRKSTLIRKLKAPHICRNKCKISPMTTDIQHSATVPQHCMLRALPDKCQKCPPVH